jgi:hypothetical protein
LNTRNADSFHDALEAQYRDIIYEAILECETEHKTRMDLGKLNSKLKLITKAAKYDGLTDHTVNQMIDEAVAHAPSKAA